MNNQPASINDHPDTSVSDYFALLKPRVMSLVVFTGICTLFIVPERPHLFLAFIQILALAFGAGAAGAFNMWYDRDIDAVMTRTANRPVATGLIPASEALAFAIIFSLFSVMMMGLASNWVAAFWLAFANIFYSIIYTMILKRRTAQNIVIGGAAGAFPPVIMWAAATGGTPVEAWVLFAIIFFWTPPHFWALALYASGDYEKASVPMMPLTHGHKKTKWQMLIYTLILLPITILPTPLGMANITYAIAAVILGGLFVISAITVLREGDNKMIMAKRMFGYSIFYLFALFTALAVFAESTG